MTERLIIVSNRGPAEFGMNEAGNRTVRRGGGGLVTALTGGVDRRAMLAVFILLLAAANIMTALAGGEKEKFARNLSLKFLSFAVGRGTTFSDETAVRELTENLIASNFEPDAFITELVKSYPFRMKIRDFQKRVNEIE
jgi:hypothetical protein